MKKIIQYKSWPTANQYCKCVEINADWGRKGNEITISSLHSISSYLAMFCPALPEWFIKKYSKKNDTIYDPFCGRGTTLMRAREMERKAYGSDLNPYAIVLSRSKINHIDNIECLLKKVNTLQKRFSRWYIFNFKKFLEQKYKELRIYYSNKVLSQLIFLREKLGKKWRKFNKIENAVIAFTLGIMHGQTKKNGTSIYFSLDMPNTISMSPNYVKKYSKLHKLKKPDSCIFEKIKSRIISKYDPILEKQINGQVFEIDSTTINHQIADKSIDLVFTSPPYLNIVDYINSNWLKLWLLGYERKNMKNQIKLSDKLKFDEYIVFVQSFLNALYSKLKKKSKVCLVVADVNGKKLIENVWEKIKNKVKYKFITIYYDYKYRKNVKILNKMIYQQFDD